MIQAFERRFEELLVQLGEVEQTKTAEKFIDAPLFLEWRVKARNLLLQACGAQSEHYKEFQKMERNPPLYSQRSHSFMQNLKVRLKSG